MMPTEAGMKSSDKCRSSSVVNPTSSVSSSSRMASQRNNSTRPITAPGMEIGSRNDTTSPSSKNNSTLMKPLIMVISLSDQDTARKIDHSHPTQPKPAARNLR